MDLKPSKGAKAVILCGGKAYTLQEVVSSRDSRDQAQKSRLISFLALKHEYFIYIQCGLSCGTEGETGYSYGTERKRVTDGKRSDMMVTGREEREEKMAQGYRIPKLLLILNS
jgi:hypothetical protein